MRSVLSKILFFLVAPAIFFAILLPGIILFLSTFSDSGQIPEVYVYILFGSVFLASAFYLLILVRYVYNYQKKLNPSTKIDLSFVRKITKVNKNLLVALNKDFTIAWTNDIKLLKNLLKIKFDIQIYQKSIQSLIGKSLYKHLETQNLSDTKITIESESGPRHFIVSSTNKWFLIFRPNDLAERVKTFGPSTRSVFFVLELDNFSSASINSSVFEQKKSEIVASITIYLNEIFRSLSQILLTLSKGEFLIILEPACLEKMLKADFPQIAEVQKKIFAKYKFNITFSAGAYFDDSNFFVSESKIDFYKFSLFEAINKSGQAKKLAQQRGGDQTIIVYPNNKIKSFGNQSGKIKTVPLQSQSYYEFCKLLPKYENILIFGHSNPDLDVFGAAIGLKKFIQEKSMNTETQFVSTSVSPLIKKEVIELIGEEKYKENVVEEFDISKWIKTKNKKLIILVDTSNVDFIDFEYKDFKNCNLAIFDHHNSEHSSNKLKFNLTSLEASSTSELVLLLWSQLKLKQSIEIPTYVTIILFAGLLSDTNSLQTNLGKTTSAALNFVQNSGIEPQTIIDKLKQFRLDQEKTYKVKIEEFQNKELAPNIRVFSNVIENNSQFQAAYLADLISEKYLKDSVILVLGKSNTAKGDVFVSIRSRGQINAGSISKELGGGGDNQRGAAQLKSVVFSEILQKINELILQKTTK